jgi:hypothetical protein
MATRSESEKPRVIEYLYERYKRGELPDGLVTNNDIVAAISATGSPLSKANPANFMKDIVRTKSANVYWPEALKKDHITARQRYGAKRVFQFVTYPKNQPEPFPDRFPHDKKTKEYKVQSASLPFAARQMGRAEETWLTQIVVNLRLVETQLSLFSPLGPSVRDVTHLQMGLKTQPEIDAVFLASYGSSEDLNAPTEFHTLITCEAKQIGQRILEDQIREQVAKAMEITVDITEPKIASVKPMAISVVEQKFEGQAECVIYIIEFGGIDRNEFATKWAPTDEGEQLYKMPLKPVSKALYRIIPPIAGLNAQH